MPPVVQAARVVVLVLAVAYQAVQTVQVEEPNHGNHGDGNDGVGKGNGGSSGNNPNARGNGHHASAGQLSLLTMPSMGMTTGAATTRLMAQTAGISTTPTLSTEVTHYLYDGSAIMKEYGAQGDPLREYYNVNGQTIGQQNFWFSQS